MRRAAIVLLAALGLTAICVATPVVSPSGTAAAAAAAGADDVVAVMIEGTGLGHGRGMSQWGAYGWAVDQGKDWKWILDHYYGGTALGDVSSAQTRLRVRLLRHDGDTTVGVISSSGDASGGGQTARSLYAQEISANRFEIWGTDSIACPGGATMTVPSGDPTIAKYSGNTAAVRQIQTFLNAYRVGGDATLAVDGDFGNLTEARLKDWQGDQSLPVDGVWGTDDAARANTLIGGGGATVNWTRRATVTGPVTFTNASSEVSSASPTSVLGVCSDSGAVTHYRGKIEVRSDGDGNHVVNDVKTEDYLRGVVPKEVSASWGDAGGGKGKQALMAQAVAARSYALVSNRYPYASICDSSSCQVYGGAATRPTATGVAALVEDSRTDTAIRATAGKVRTWPGGTIVSTEFSASNGPRTAGGAFPPVDDAPGDGTANNPNHRWTRVLDADMLAARYGLGTLTGASMVEASSSVYQAYDGIWFNDIVLTGSNGHTYRKQAWDFRGTYGLPSPGFTVRVVTADSNGQSFGMIGDSVGNSIAGPSNSELRTLTDGTFTSSSIDVADGRCTTQVCNGKTSGVQAAGALPMNLDLVVVELGYNDKADAPEIDAMMAALRARNVGQVAWVNMADIRTFGGSSAYAPSNAALDAAQARYSNLTVLDWNSASNTPERSRWFTDGVHLSSTGQAQFALWLREQVLTIVPSHWLAPPKILHLPVVGQQLTAPDGTKVTVPADATAVSLNVTAVDATAAGFVSVWPCGVPRPTSSNLNFPPDVRVANGVIAPIGAAGEVCLYAHAGTDLVVDIAGWFGGGAASSGFVGTTPQRLVDTRDGTGGRTGRVTPATPLKIPVVGASLKLPDGTATKVPAGVTSVALNVTAVDPIGRGFVSVWPCDVPRPNSSSLNFTPGLRVANGVIAPVAADGSVCLYAHQPVDVVVDIAGWFGGGSATPTFVGATPERLVDTRDGTGGRTGRVTQSTPLSIPVRGVALTVRGSTVAVPADATAVALNLTIVDSDQNGFATVWPCDQPRPDSSNVNFRPGLRVANGVIAPVGASGNACVYTHVDAYVVVDIVGWFSGGTGSGFVGVTPHRVVDTRTALGPAPT